MMDFTHVFAEPDAHNIIDAVHPTTGRGVYSGETLEEVRKRYPLAQLETFDAWSARKAARQDTPITWHETTAEQYDEMLCVLPPAVHRYDGFMVGEPDDHHATTGRPRFRAYIARYGRYFVASRPMTIAEYHAIVPGVRLPQTSAESQTFIDTGELPTA